MAGSFPTDALVRQRSVNKADYHIVLLMSETLRRLQQRLTGILINLVQRPDFRKPWSQEAMKILS